MTKSNNRNSIEKHNFFLTLYNENIRSQLKIGVKN